MTIVGIGTDLVEIARIEALLARHPQRFAQRILHPHELERFAAVEHKAAWLAKRFATKEAVAKALGTGIGRAARFVDIETTHNAQGKPILRLHAVTLATAEALGVKMYEISVSDERSYALAFVILLC